MKFLLPSLLLAGTAFLAGCAALPRDAGPMQHDMGAMNDCCKDMMATDDAAGSCCKGGADGASSCCNMAMNNHADMTMDEMVRMLDGKTGTAFDLAFVEGMIPHHQGAIDMAKLALVHARHDEIKTMAREIIEAQQREIDMMRQWQQQWSSAR